MNIRETFGKILGLYSGDELKALCKQWGLKGFSKYNKADLVNFISVQTSEETIPAFLDGEGKKKVQEIVKNAYALLDNISVSREKLGTIDVEGDKIVVTFDGLQWKTEFSASIPKIGEPGFEFACDCKAADSGALCIHFWTAIVHLLAQGTIKMDSIGPFSSIAGDTIEAGVKKLAARGSAVNAPVDTSGKTLHEFLQARTQGSRFENALVELGLATPTEPKKKAKKTKSEQEPQGNEKKEEPRLVEVHFTEKILGPPARLLASWYRLEADGKRESSLRALIDEKQKVIAHEGCQDFAFRLAKQKQLCKHLIQLLVSIEEPVARRLLGELDRFRYTSEMTGVKQAEKSISKEVMETKPTVTMADQESLKNLVMDYLLGHEGDEEQLSVDAIGAALGKNVVDILPVLKAEGMVTEYKTGYYKVK
nr:hypothetical protein [Candidatus Sigynarchaeota archaeon]